jgi:ribose 5-phosphate isomerase B
LCHDETTARLCREHNDANVLALGARVIGPEVARACLTVFLATKFAGGRHEKRVAKLG